MDYLSLYSENCKKCSALDPDESKLFKSCHYSTGNTQCPASEVQFAVVGKAQRYANALAKARRNGDLAKEAKIIDAVSTKSSAFQHKFKELVG